MKPTTLKSNLNEPAFREALHVGRPNVGCVAEVHRRIDEIFERRWLSNSGIVVEEFEQRIAEFVGVKHCLAVCNATIGLDLVYRAAEFSGEVIVPSNTFAATVHALQWQGLKPVFCDIDPVTHNLDPRRVEECITERTSGIVGVHLWGRPCPVEALERIAESFDLKLVFDAAHAFGCSLNGRMIGGFGDAEVFSFHATKFVTCGEGGAIVTNDDNLADRIRRLRCFGIDGTDRFVSLGTNGKMSEFAAAVGIASLMSIQEFIEANERNHRAYQKVLGDVPGLSLLHFDNQERNNFQYVVVEIDEWLSPLTRDQWLQVLHAENVLARRYFYPGVHRAEPYRSLDPFVAHRLPCTERILRRILVLPTGTAVKVEDIERIGGIFVQAVAEASRLRHQLPTTLALPTVPLLPSEKRAA